MRTVAMRVTNPSEKPMSGPRMNTEEDFTTETTESTEGKALLPCCLPSVLSVVSGVKSSSVFIRGPDIGAAGLALLAHPRDALARLFDDRQRDQRHPARAGRRLAVAGGHGQ